QVLAASDLRPRFNRVTPGGAQRPAQAGQQELVITGEVILKVDDQLTNADPKDKVQQMSRQKVHTVNLAAGQTYQIDMITREKQKQLGGFDPLLRLENAQGEQLAMDDDGGGFPNARIVF